MTKPQKGVPKTYYIGFGGTDEVIPVIATSAKQAKQKFADFHGIRVSSYIVERRKNISPGYMRMKPIV